MSITSKRVDLVFDAEQQEIFYEYVNGLQQQSLTEQVDAIDLSNPIVFSNPINGASLKGANSYGECETFACNFVSKHGGERYGINIGKNGLIGTPTQGLADNGYHEFVEKEIDGQTMIFDNMHPDGILKSEYIEQIGGYTRETGPIEGDELLNNYTKKVENN